MGLLVSSGMPAVRLLKCLPTSCLAVERTAVPLSGPDGLDRGVRVGGGDVAELRVLFRAVVGFVVQRVRDPGLWDVTWGSWVVL
jgi:hypothetical protein